jgi:hypothetical protein
MKSHIKLLVKVHIIGYGIEIFSEFFQASQNKTEKSGY